jgi:hypothetical protein
MAETGGTNMNSLRRSILFAVSVLACVPVPVLAQSPATGAASQSTAKPSVKVDVEPSLIVMNARGATLTDHTLTLEGVSANVIIFADRPVRAAGHLLTTHVLEEWDGNGSFAQDAPNATVSVLGRDGGSVKDVVVELRKPRPDGDNLTFDVRVLEGDLAGANGPASVFIDIIGLPFTPLSYAGVARRSARRAYWYGMRPPPYPAYPPLYYPRPYYPY